jgi:hypothetical protein
VRHHRVDISRAYEKSQPRSAKALEILAGTEIGLRQESDSEAPILKHAANYRRAKGRMVNVCVSRYVNEVGAIPSATHHILFCYWKKSVYIFHYVLRVRQGVGTAQRFLLSFFIPNIRMSIGERKLGERKSTIFIIKHLLSIGFT